MVVAVDDSSHPEEDGYVRAHLSEGWVLESRDDGSATHVTSIWSVDIKVSLPPHPKLSPCVSAPTTTPEDTSDRVGPAQPCSDWRPSLTPSLDDMT